TDLFQMTSSCDDAGTSCGASTTVVCYGVAGDGVPSSVLQPFFNAACPTLVGCSAYSSQSACESALGASTVVTALKAYPDDKISCTATCVQGLTCGAL